MLKNISRDESILNDYIDKKPKKNIKAEIKEIQNKINKNNKILDSLTDKLILLEGSAAQKIANKMNSISEENDDLNNRLLSLERENILDSIDTMNVDTLQDNIKTLLSNWDQLTMEEKQIEIGNIISEIRFDGNNDFHVVFNI